MAPEVAQQLRSVDGRFRCVVFFDRARELAATTTLSVVDRSDLLRRAAEYGVCPKLGPERYGGGGRL